MRTGTPIGYSDTKKTVIKNLSENINTLTKWSKLAVNVSTENEAYALELSSVSQGKILIGSLNKPKEGGGGNRGDIAEGILGAAITARFINKNLPIKVSHVYDVLKSMEGSGSKRETLYKSVNANPHIIDDVRFFLSLAIPNINALCNSKNWPSLIDLFHSAVVYANGETVREWSELLYNNNQYNYIEVISDGLGGQKSTKVDIRVMVDKKITNLNISLKAGDVKQFGQVGGSEFEKQEYLWEKAVKIDVRFLRNEYDKLIAEKKATDAIFKVYNYVQREMNKAFSSSVSSEKLLNNLSDGILFFATLNEENVTLVQLTHQEAKIYRFENVKKLISGLTELRADLKESSGKPKLIISNKGGKVLLEFRVKQENKPNGEIYFRNYIEKGPLLGDLIASMA